MTKAELFLLLAQPDANGVSRWVGVGEFVGKYAQLKFGNGASWARKETPLAKSYLIEFDREQSAGNSIDRIRLNGKYAVKSTQYVRPDIRKAIVAERCVVLGVSGVECDHKNGRKMNAGGDATALNPETQQAQQFQPLCKAANDAKRQHCKVCSQTNIRFDARLLGYPISYYHGGPVHTGQADGCTGCFWYDPVEFRQHLVNAD